MNWMSNNLQNWYESQPHFNPDVPTKWSQYQICTLNFKWNYSNCWIHVAWQASEETSLWVIMKPFQSRQIVRVFIQDNWLYKCVMTLHECNALLRLMYICSMDFSSLSKGANLIFIDEVYSLQVTNNTMSKK
jgi:hypothetical protein